MPSLTTNFSLNKPLVNNATDEDLWGGYLNDNMDTLDTQLKVARDFVTRSISGADTATTADRNKLILCSASGGALAPVLPSAATAGSGFEIAYKKTDSSGNAVTVTRASSQTIDGATTYALTGQYNTVVLVSDGANWHIKDKVVSATAVASASTTSEGIVELLTEAELEAGTDSSRAATAIAIKGAFGYSKYYESSEQSITASSLITLTHSLGAIPKQMIVELVCKTTDLGWAVGDRVVSSSAIGQGTSFGIAVGYSTTSLFAIPSTAIQILNKSTGTGASITLASWRIVIRAWA